MKTSKTLLLASAGAVLIFAGGVYAADIKIGAQNEVVETNVSSTPTVSPPPATETKVTVEVPPPAPVEPQPTSEKKVDAVQAPSVIATKPKTDTSKIEPESSNKTTITVTQPAVQVEVKPADVKPKERTKPSVETTVDTTIEPPKVKVDQKITVQPEVMTSPEGEPKSDAVEKDGTYVDDEAAASASEAGVPDCKVVKVYRPDINPHHPEISIQFIDVTDGPGALLIEKCSQPADFIRVTGTHDGVIVRLRTAEGVGEVALPIRFTEGRADQVVCRRDPNSRVITHRKYAVQWSLGLPTDIKLEPVTSYDTKAADEGCQRALVDLK
jgi:hypothetical protein